MKNLILISILIFSISSSNSQFIKNFGLKAGLLNNTLYTTDRSNGLVNIPGGDFWGYDLGIFVEFSGYKKLSFVGELNFDEKGSPVSIAVYPFSNSYYNFIFSNRFQYLTLSGLAKYSFINDEIDLYGIVGGRTEMMVNNYYSEDYYNSDFIKLRNFNFEFGGTIGFGFGIHPGVFLEFQYVPNFTSVYRVTYDDGHQSSYRNSSMILILGINFK